VKKLTKQLFESPMSVTLGTCEGMQDYNPSDAVAIANQFTLALDKWETRTKRTPTLSTSMAAAILWVIRCMEAQFANDEDAE